MSRPGDPKPSRADPPPSSSDDDTPGVPGFRTWRGVYLFVLGVFILVVVALTLFTHAYR